MADTTFSHLPAADAVADETVFGTDSAAGITQKVTGAQIKAFIAAGIIVSNLGNQFRLIVTENEDGSAALGIQKV